MPDLVTVATSLVALGIAFAFPDVGLWSLLLLVAAPVVSRLVSRARRPDRVR